MRALLALAVIVVSVAVEADNRCDNHDYITKH
jgi:hypothetical protein